MTSDHADAHRLRVRRTAEAVVGVDVGGTRTKVGLVDRDGAILDSAIVPSEPTGDRSSGFELVLKTIDGLLRTASQFRLAAIGVGASGPVNRQRGTVENPHTLPGWVAVPVRERLARRYGVPVVLENDADAAALGEYWMGAGSETSPLLVVTAGTGIGVALILDGQVYRGADGQHAEAGHHTIDMRGPRCYCGARGCWEFMAAGTAIARLARERAQSRPRGQAPGPTVAAEADAEAVARAAAGGDDTAVGIMNEVAEAFAVGLVNLVSAVLPRLVVLSGGVMHSYELFADRCRQELADRSAMLAVRPTIAPSALLDTGGLVGAAYAGWHAAPRGGAAGGAP